MLKNLLAISTIALLSGCSTVVNGTKQHVNITSDPSGALVYADGAQIGKTPLIYTYPRGDEPKIEIKKNGYATERFIISDSFCPGSYLAGNTALTLCTIFGVVGFLVDPVTGAMWEADRNMFNIELTPLPQAPKKSK